MLGLSDGECDTDGADDGDVVGMDVGVPVGELDKDPEGTTVGAVVGDADGWASVRA